MKQNKLFSLLFLGLVASVSMLLLFSCPQRNKSKEGKKCKITLMLKSTCG